MKSRPAAIALLAGNFIVGLCVLAPAAMLKELSEGLSVGIADAGLLVTYGAVVLCICSPVVSGLTSGIDRRTLLAGSVAIMAIASIASAAAPNYPTLMALRLAMLVAVAPFTPQAASTIALIVPEKERASAISFVFLGWSMSVAVGLPLLTFLADRLGWRLCFAVLAVAAVLSVAALFLWIPTKLFGTRVSLQSWVTISRNRQIVLLLVATMLAVAGQFAIATYLSPLLRKTIGADAATVSIFFALFGIAGVVGNALVTRVVTKVGAFTTSVLFLLSTLAGLLIWSVGLGVVAVMVAGVLFWGFGFAAVNSMQQTRLIASAPPLAGGSVALNTSFIYIGQAIGSAFGGILIERDLIALIGYLSVLSVIAAIGVVFLTRAPTERLWPAAQRSPAE